VFLSATPLFCLGETRQLQKKKRKKKKKKRSKRKDRKSSPFFSLFVYLLSLSHPALVRITHPTGRGEGRAPQKKAFFITRSSYHIFTGR
jgi:hypothetical protein